MLGKENYFPHFMKVRRLLQKFDTKEILSSAELLGANKLFIAVCCLPGHGGTQTTTTTAGLWLSSCRSAPWLVFRSGTVAARRL